MKKTLLPLMLFMFLGLASTGLQAQRNILRDLRDRTIDKTVDKVIDRTAEKLAEQMANAIMNMLTPNFEKWMQGSGTPFDPSLLPESYAFHYLYRMEITSQEGPMVIDYFLNQDKANYIGVQFGEGTNMFMVIDYDLQATITYMEIGDKLHATAMENKVTEEEEAENLESMENFTITELPNREFLGYDCLGRKMEDESYAFTMYIAPDMEAQMGNMFSPGNQEVSPALAAYGKQFENGLMMHMEITDKKGSPGSNMNGTMECIAYEPQARTLSSGDYQFDQGMRSLNSR